MKYKFVHIPKTGGSYFFRAVQAENLNVEYIGHKFPYNVEVEEGEGPRQLGHYSIDDGCEYISIVRNPFDLLHSYYHYDGMDGSKGWANCRTVHNVESFSEFVEYYLKPDAWFHYPPLKKSLFAMIKDSNNRVIPHHILKFENLTQDVEHFCSSVNLKHRPLAEDCKDRNKSKTTKNAYTSDYTSLQIERLSNVWKEDLKYFNYDF